MKHTLFALSLFISSALFAQPVLTNTSQIGYVAPVAVASAATASLVPIATTGANATWNCAGLVKDAGIPIINYTVSSPAGTMYAADYAAANWYFTDPALVAVVGHNYFNLSMDSFVLWGVHVTGSAYEIYDNPEMDLKFPFGYNQTVVNTYSKTNYTAAGGISSYQTGDVTLSYDGYGTLILPGGTYNNVVRIKKVRTNNLGPTLNSYTWYDGSTGERLLVYEEKAGGIINVVYSTSVVNALSDIDTKAAVTLRNDASGRITITADAPIKSVAVYAVTGQKVASYRNVADTHFQLTLPAARGMYIVQVETEKASFTGKVVY